jgi:hypothetical protein
VHAPQDLPGRLLRPHHGVQDGDRPGTHGGQVVDVGQHRRDAGAVRVGGHEGGQDRLPADDDRSGAVGQHRAVVARTGVPVTPAQDVGHQADVGLGPHTGQRAQGDRQLGEVAGQVGDGEIGPTALSHGALLGIGNPVGGCVGR